MRDCGTQLGENKNKKVWTTNVPVVDFILRGNIISLSWEAIGVKAAAQKFQNILYRKKTLVMKCISFCITVYSFDFYILYSFEQ